MSAARAWAWLSGRDYVTPDDVKALARPALRHRVELRPEAELEGVTPDAVLDGVLGTVPVPRLSAGSRGADRAAGAARRRRGGCVVGLLAPTGWGVLVATLAAAGPGRGRRRAGRAGGVAAAAPRRRRRRAPRRAGRRCG